MKVKTKCTTDKRQRGHPYIIKYSYGADPVTGNEKWEHASFKYKAEREKFKADLLAGTRQVGTDTTLKDFVTDWQRTAKSRLRPKSRDLYRQTIDRLLAYFGPQCLLRNVTPRIAARFIAELRPIRFKTLSNWSKDRTLRNCKTLFQTALDWELITKNPFKKVRAPKCLTRRWYYVRPYQYKTLLEVAPNLRWKAFYALAYTAGLRFGELYNLTWADIDFERGEVRIENRRATATKPPFLVKDYEARRIPLPEHTLHILADLRAYNEITDRTEYVLLDERRYKVVVAKWQRFQEQGREWKNQDMANNVGRDFGRHLRRAGIEPDAELTPHTLRKCCIQNWANELPINVTKELAGHSSIATTQKYYLQVDEYHRQKAAAVIEDLVVNAKEEVKQRYGFGTD